MTKEEEVIEIDKEIKEVLARHPNFALGATPFIDPTGALRAKPALVYLKEEGSVLAES